MQDFESSPTRNIPDGDISRSHLPKRLQEFNKTMDGLMNLLCGPLSFDEVRSQDCFDFFTKIYVEKLI